MPDLPLRAWLSARLRDRGRLVAQALVLTLVVAGTSAFALLHKTVTLDVDGTLTSVSAFGRTSGDILAAQGVSVGDGDLVVPGLDEVVHDDDTLVVRHGREVRVLVDGEERTVWTTALTVGEVMTQLGVRGEARASASRSATLGRGLLQVSTTKTVHLAVDGTTTDMTTSASTVREVLVEAGVVMGELDRVSVPLDAAAVDGMVVLVTRVTTEARSQTTAQPFETVERKDPGLPEGQRVVSVEGRPGSSVVTYMAHLVGDVEVGRTVLGRVVLETPVDRVVRVGTMTASDVPAVEPGTARALGLEMMLARGFAESEFACLDKLWTKESGWRVNAENRSSGAYGIPQALPGSKMASVADDWRTNPRTQITWGLNYVEDRYDTPCGAWAHFLRKNWY